MTDVQSPADHPAVTVREDHNFVGMDVRVRDREGTIAAIWEIEAADDTHLRIDIETDDGIVNATPGSDPVEVL